MHVEVAGTKTNSADEVLTRIVDYGLISGALVALAMAVAALAYPLWARVGFVATIALFLIAYHFVVTRDTRPTLESRAVSAWWFGAAVMFAWLGFAAGKDLQINGANTPLGVLSMVPFQLAIGWMAFLCLQAWRQRHAILVTLAGLVTVPAVVAVLNLMRFHAAEWAALVALLPTAGLLGLGEGDPRHQRPKRQRPGPW